MRKMKTISAMFTVFAMAAAICGSAVEAKAADYTLKVGYTQNEDDPTSKGLFKFEELVEERTEGAVDIEVYCSSQLGDTSDMVEQAKIGTNVGCITDASRFDGSVPEIAILNAPYVFADYEEGVKVIESDICKALCDKLLAVEGLRVLSFNHWQGYRNFVTTSKVESVADMAGLRLRSPGTALYDGMIEALGAKPASLAQAEIYNAIETGVVDGAENAVPGIYNNRFYEVADYMCRDMHIQLFSAIVVGEDWFQTLPEEYQTILVEASYEAGEYSSALAMEACEECDRLMQEAGMTVTDVDVAEFAEACAVMYEDMPELAAAKAEIDEFLGK